MFFFFGFIGVPSRIAYKAQQKRMAEVNQNLATGPKKCQPGIPKIIGLPC